MSRNSSDLRVRRTQKLLQEALIALIEERKFDTLTVGEIAERAMVSRAAFYRHYQDKYDLLEKIFVETMALLAHDIDPLYQDLLRRFASHPPSDPWAELFSQTIEADSIPEPWVKFFEHVAQYERLYHALLGKNGNFWFATRMRSYLADAMGTYLQTVASRIGMKTLAENQAFVDGLVPTLLAAQLVDIITWWLEQERPYPPRQIAAYYYRLRSSLLKEAGCWR